MQNNLITGIHFFFQGLSLIFSKGFKRFIIVPIFINLLLLLAIFGTLSHYIRNYLSNYQDTTAWYMVIIAWLIWLLFWIFTLLISSFIFTMLTNLIACPFYGLLAEKTEKKVSTHLSYATLSPWRLLPHTVMREFKKFFYFLPWLILCGVLFFIPFTTLLSPFVGYGVLAWILAIQYVDYVADNQQVTLTKMIAALKKVPLTALGFGGIVTLFMIIPGANLIVPPAAVAGGTLLWLSLFQKDKLNLNS